MQSQPEKKDLEYQADIMANPSLAILCPEEAVTTSSSLHVFRMPTSLHVLCMPTGHEGSM